MKNKHPLLIGGVFAILVSLALQTTLCAQAPQYVVTALGTLGGSESGANAINNSGQVVGYSETSGNAAEDATLFSGTGGGNTDLGTLGGSDSSAYGINNSGQVVGESYSTDDTGQYATLFSGNGSGNTDLGALGGTYSSAFGINDSGQVVGWSDTSGATQLATLFSVSGNTDLDSLGGSYSNALSINNSGQIVGWSDTSGATQLATLFSGNGSGNTDLGGGPESAAIAINNSGQIVGYSDISGNASTHATLFSGNGSGNIDLGTLGGTFSIAIGVNNSGQIIGNSETSDDVNDGFIYTAGVMTDLNSLVPSNVGVTDIDIGTGNAINDLGQIAANGTVNGQTEALLLTPRNMGTQFSGGLGNVSNVGGTFQSAACGVSNGGSAVTGLGTDSFGPTAFSWTLNSGMVDLHTNSSAGGSAVGQAVSADGSTIVGYSGNQAFRYTASGGAQELGFIPDGTNSYALAVSGNGSVVVGGATGAEGTQPFIWTQATGMVGLGNLPGGSSFNGQGLGVSGNGSIVVGYSQSASSDSGFQAFSWTEATGMVGLGYLPGGVDNSAADAVSYNGSVTVGHAANANGEQAVAWVNGGAPEALGNLNGTTGGSVAYSVSGDGGVIVGFSDNEAFVWDEAHGMQNLQSVLSSEFGVDFTGWSLTSADAIDPDATTIVGSGIDPLGNTQAFEAQINSRTYRFMSGDAYNTFQTEHLGGFGTSLALLDGTAGGVSDAFRTVTAAMLNDSAVSSTPGAGYASDIADVTGMSGDTYVLQLSVNPATAASLLGGVGNARLDWLNPNTDIWENAVDGNTGGSIVQFVNGAYIPGTDLQLGDYGVNTSNDMVWAVVNETGDFVVSNLNPGGVATPEPGTCTMLVIGVVGLGLFRRRNRFR